MTTNETDIVKGLQSQFMLVSFVQTTWSTRVDDPAAARKAEQALGAKIGSRKAAVNVLAGNDERYRAVINAIGRARKLHESLTFSWGGKQRALHMSRYMSYMKQMGKAIAEFVELRDVFEANWDQDVAATRAAASADPQDLINYYTYPTAESVSTRFTIRLEPCPISSESNFPPVLQAQNGAAVANAYKDALSRKMRNAIALRMQELVELIEQVVERFTDAPGTERAPVLRQTLLSTPLEKIDFLRESILDDFMDDYAQALTTARTIFADASLDTMRGTSERAEQARFQLRRDCENWLQVYGDHYEEKGEE